LISHGRLSPETGDAEDTEGRYRAGLASGISAWCKDCFSRGFMDLLSVDDCRKSEVLDDIGIGSTPKATYYLLLSISVLISGFGVLTNSPAVVIGAMLVSPLMTPIFGISLGLVRGDMVLLRKAFVAEFGGVVIAVGVAAILGMFPFAQEVTPEMLSRTSPTLLDLLVAALAGVAGCLAMIDERISPVLPGIAMATALTPPLAVSGLCLAFGAYEGAWGAFFYFSPIFWPFWRFQQRSFYRSGVCQPGRNGFQVGCFETVPGAGCGVDPGDGSVDQRPDRHYREKRDHKSHKGILEEELSTERGPVWKT
jgi:uncharacterized hydrophobic protein (TIGR00271 family)